MDINATLDSILKLYKEEEQEKIREVYRIAEETLRGKQRENKHPFIEHPLGVASIVASEIGLGYDSVIAVFLHESIRFFPDLLERLPKGSISEEIINIALSLNKISAIKPKETKLEASNYKRLIVSYSKDPRVTLIKLADRLDVMRNISLLPKSSQDRKVTETMFLYIPIAHQLGLYNLKSEMENIYFQHTDPEHYREITNRLKATEGEREQLVRSFIEPLKKKIAASGIKVTIKQRTKSAYSIWKKMQKQEVPFEKVKDLLAIRVIIDTEPVREKEHELCWKIYSIVTEEFTPDTSRMRDWLSKPKENGYESLHTTVSDKEGHSVEVQIRTVRMDIAAESGNASHWSYKGIQEEKGLTQWLSGVRNILETHNIDKTDDISRLMEDDVFVFTPDGELRRLPQGATVLDFAFNIHSNLGARCSGALIDGKAVSIRERLTTGQVVEIKTSKNQKPSRDWLNIVVTSKAKSKIRQKIKEEETRKADAGKELLERRLKNWKLELNDEDLGLLCKKYRHKTINDFFAALEDGDIDPIEIKNFLKCKDKGEECREKEKTGSCIREHQNTSDYLTIDGNLNNIGYKMAKCCNPIYGDEIFGFVSIKDGIKIHRLSCPNAARLMKEYPYRIQKVRWKENTPGEQFQTTLKVIIDDTQAYPKILELISGFGASLRSSSFTPKTGRSAGEYDVRVQVLVSGNKVLDKILSTIKKTRGVLSATRIAK